MAYDVDDFDWAPPVAEQQAPPDAVDAPLAELGLGPKMAQLVTDGFHEGNGYASRSEADAAVVAALVKTGCSDEQIHGVFERFPIGAKFRDKGRDGPRYLDRTIAFVRNRRAAENRNGFRDPAPARSDDAIAYLDLETVARDGVPPVEWLLHGWIAERDVALLAGAGGIGKSTAAAAIAVAMARGRPWCGVRAERGVRVLYVDEEQDEATCARLFIRLGAPVPNLRVACGQGVRLDSVAGVGRLEAQIAEWQAELVVMDSVQQVFGAVKENDATEVGSVYRALFGLRDRYATAFLLTHHKRKAVAGLPSEGLEMVRGSTAHGTQASTVWYAYSTGPDRLNVVQAKRRGGAKTSLVVGYSAREPDGPITLSGEGRVEDAETELAKASEWIKAYLDEHGTGKREAIFQAAMDAGMSKGTLVRAIDHALRIGAIEREARGVYVSCETKSQGMRRP